METVPRVWQSLLHPLCVKQIPSGHWQITIEKTDHNVMHSEDSLFVLYGTEAEARSAYEKVKAMRVDYRKHGTLKIKVNV